MHRYFYIFSRTIPAYGLFMVLGLCLSSGLAAARGKRQGIDPNDTLIIAATCVCGALLGGGGLYLATAYGWRQLWRWIMTGNFSFMTDGGLVFYGGLIGGIAFLPLGMLFSGEKRLASMANAYVPAIPLGHGIGRVGCLFAGCCYGLPYAGVGAVRLEEAGIPYPVFPIQLVEAGLNFCLSYALARMSRKKPRGLCLLCVYLLCYGVERFVLEFFRGDLIRGSIGGFSTSQWLSILLGASAAVVLAVEARQPGGLFEKSANDLHSAVK